MERLTREALFTKDYSSYVGLFGDINSPDGNMSASEVKEACFELLRSIAPDAIPIYDGKHCIAEIYTATYMLKTLYDKDAVPGQTSDTEESDFFRNLTFGEFIEWIPEAKTIKMSEALNKIEDVINQVSPERLSQITKWAIDHGADPDLFGGASTDDAGDDDNGVDSEFDRIKKYIKLANGAGDATVSDALYKYAILIVKNSVLSTQEAINAADMIENNTDTAKALKEELCKLIAGSDEVAKDPAAEPIVVGSGSKKGNSKFIGLPKTLPVDVAGKVVLAPDVVRLTSEAAAKIQQHPKSNFRYKFIDVSKVNDTESSFDYAYMIEARTAEAIVVKFTKPNDAGDFNFAISTHARKDLV